MKPQLKAGAFSGWLGAPLAVGLTTALLVWVEAESTTAGLIFLVLIVWIATQAEMAVSLFAALLSTLAFDYYFLPPYRTLRLAGISEWVAVLSFFGSSVVAGRVAERARGQARKAEQRRADVERLYLLSQEMMLYDDASKLKDELPRIIERVFALEGVILYASDENRCFSSAAELPMNVLASLSALTTAPVVVHALPGDIWAMPLNVGVRSVGALGWRPATLSREVATAITAQVGIALTRAAAIEASTRLEASREGERLRTALIDSLTHELRTPLTSIRAAASTLVQNEGLDDPARSELVTIVDEESARLDALIGEAVEMAELDANVVQVHARRQPTRALLEHAVEVSHAALKRHSVVIQIEEPDTPLWFDAQLLSRVLRHLLENAARYSPRESRIVLRSRHAGDRLEFAVEDNGPGIHSSDLPFIFEKFYRGKKSAGKGTGMGLAIARAILLAHNGGIDVTSTPGQGATFHFWIPLVEKDPRS